ncbi:MAG: ferritin-like domain-containing protein [Alphaproteobacteria bacterium]|nr:ferritin-like domain-containing protein [Alphaproteobacteria bacterium]MDP3532011.1 ferritin-like domain-containing protein [Alphaproteobacteria bacterium]
MKHWTIEDIDWDKFDPSLVDPQIIPVIKTASLVEYNGRHYAAYLHNIFNDEPDFKELATEWAEEEVQHGVVLGKWAELADPSFSFDASFRKFSDGYQIPLDKTTSVRGSRSGELIARCIVETATSSMYTALTEATKEPVLKQIAQKIAADEFRHYKLFYDHFKVHNKQDKLNFFQRLSIVIKRILESQDDELSYAFYAANNIQTPYNRKASNAEYARLSYQIYKPHHIERIIAMSFKPIGLNPHGKLSKIALFAFTKFLNWQQKN